MKTGKLSSSLIVLGIGLITPFFIWIVLYTVSLQKQQSFDPNPLIQDLVEHPRTIHREGSTRWVELFGKDGAWSVKDKNGQLTPLDKMPVDGDFLILVLEAQGPTLAAELFHFLKDHDLFKKIILLSASDGILKDLRFHDGQLTEGAGQAFLIRFRALQRLGLENLLRIETSAALLDPKIMGDSLRELTDTFTAHKMAVFIGPNANLEGNTDLEKKANLLVD